MKIIESKPVSMLEARDVLSDLEKERGEELGYEQKITLDYLRTRKMPTKKDLESLKSELEKIDVLKDTQIMSIINMLPKDENEINTLFMKDRIKLEKDQIKAINDAIIKVIPNEKKK